MDPQQETLRQFPCPVCGQSEFEFGQLTTRYGISFAAGQGDFWNMPRDSWGSSRSGMIARHCLHCDNVQVFIRRFTPAPAE